MPRPLFLRGKCDEIPLQFTIGADKAFFSPFAGLRTPHFLFFFHLAGTLRSSVALVVLTFPTSRCDSFFFSLIAMPPTAWTGVHRLRVSPCPGRVISHSMFPYLALFQDLPGSVSGWEGLLSVSITARLASPPTPFGFAVLSCSSHFILPHLCGFTSLFTLRRSFRHGVVLFLSFLTADVGRYADTFFFSFPI